MALGVKKEKQKIIKSVNATYAQLNGRNPFVYKRDVVDEMIVELIVVEVAG